MAEHIKPNDETRATEQAEATAAHEAPQRPTDEEARAADQAEGEVDEAVREHYRDMTAKGANVKGEGQVP